MSEHWYNRDGSPFYRIIGANGKERDVTIRDARKVGAVPSVTTVLDLLAKPELTQWKVRQGILAALTLPRIADEAEDVYLARILTDSAEQAKAAAEEGTRIHDAIERSFKGLVVEDRYWPHVEATRIEIARLFPGVDDWVAEQSFCHPDGFGGKVDLYSPSTGIPIDYKGKDGDFTDGKKLAYDQNEQLGAYQYGLGFEPRHGANIFVSRTHPGKVFGHVWSPEELELGRDVFLAALAVWKLRRGYDPMAVQLQSVA